MTEVRRVNYTEGAQQGGKGGSDASSRVHEEVKKYMEQNKEKSYSKALEKVLKANPQLHREYVVDLDSGTPVADAPRSVKAPVDREGHRKDSFDPQYRRRIESRPDAPQSPLTRVPDQATALIDRGDAGALVHKAVMEYKRQYQGLTYEHALSAVLQLDPELAKRYRGMIGDVDYCDLDWQALNGRV